MTIDELIAEIRAEYKSLLDGCPPMVAKMCSETLGPFVENPVDVRDVFECPLHPETVTEFVENIVIGIIQHNRSALEGRGVLKFKWLSREEGYEECFDCEGVDIPEYGIFMTEQDCISFAESINLTAEFVEDNK